MTPPTNTDAKELAKEIRVMAYIMSGVADRMAYFAGFNGQLLEHSKELKGAAAMAMSWSDGIDEQLKERKRKKL